MPVIPVLLTDDEVKQIDLLAKGAGGSSMSRVTREITSENSLLDPSKPQV